MAGSWTGSRARSANFKNSEADVTSAVATQPRARSPEPRALFHREDGDQDADAEEDDNNHADGVNRVTHVDPTGCLECMAALRACRRFGRNLPLARRPFYEGRHLIERIPCLTRPG